MIIIDSGSELSPKDIEAQPPSQPYPGPSASTSSSPNQPHPYPQADDSNESQRLLGRTTTGNHPEPIFPGPPPAFTPYEAEWFEVGYGDVVSHDEHLNTDGEYIHTKFTNIRPSTNCYIQNRRSVISFPPHSSIPTSPKLPHPL